MRLDHKQLYYSLTTFPVFASSVLMNCTRGLSDFGRSQMEIESLSMNSLYWPSMKEKAPYLT
jgi:hypothetical protein